MCTRKGFVSVLLKRQSGAAEVFWLGGVNIQTRCLLSPSGEAVVAQNCRVLPSSSEMACTQTRCLLTVSLLGLQSHWSAVYSHCALAVRFSSWDCGYTGMCAYLPLSLRKESLWSGAGLCWECLQGVSWSHSGGMPLEYGRLIRLICRGIQGQGTSC